MLSVADKYDRMLEELFARHPSVQSSGFTAGAYKPGLDGMREFDRALGCPSKGFRSIHVAGTNGKGSVSSMLAAALSATGLRVGLYTSPHLVDFRERIKIVSEGGFEMVPREYVWDFVHGSDLDGLSFFEITTGLAFSWFASQKVDIAVIETGLGGRLDSTNIITPELSVVTSIGLDHCSLLGDTRAQIAFEKAGIFKPGVPALVFGHDPETDPVFERHAADIECPLYWGMPPDHGAAQVPFQLFVPKSPGTAAVRCCSPLNPPRNDIELDLAGPYQEMNLRTALAALQLLGVDPDMDAIAHTARITGLRGRWEVVAQDDMEVICDIGHNPQALEYNFRRLKEMHRPLVIVYGIMADKDLQGIIPLMPHEAEYILVAPKGDRALPVESLAERMKGFNARMAGSVAEGVEAAVARAREIPDAVVYVGGSNFVVAEFLASMA